MQSSVKRKKKGCKGGKAAKKYEQEETALLEQNIKAVRFDESSNEVVEYQCWIQSYEEKYPHEDSEDYELPHPKKRSAIRGKRAMRKKSRSK